jgi:Cu/Ag efflux pump CusA
VLVFLPVFFLDGLAGTFFRPLALSYILAVAASLGVALIVTPALCLILLPKVAGTKRRTDAGRLKSTYRRVLPTFLARPFAVSVALVVIFVLSGLAVTQLGEEFLPHFQEHDFLMHWVGKPGTSLQAMQRITARASRELRAIPGVRNFGSHYAKSYAMT